MKSGSFASIFFLVVCAMPSVVFASEAQLLTVPEGDPKNGRQVFTDLKCYSCHQIAGDNKVLSSIASVKGPTLGLSQSRYKPGFLADSIISPSHAIAPGFKNQDQASQLSRMGDFSDSITVRQLADLVAYLKQLDEEV